MKSILITVGTAANRVVRNTLRQQIGQVFDFIYTESEDGKEVQEELPEEYLKQWCKEPVTIVLFVTLGGETGRGISLRIVEQLKSYNLFYYFWGTLPFLFEDKKRIINAIETLKTITKIKNRCFILVQNYEKIRVELYGLSIDKAWEYANLGLMIPITKIMIIHNWLTDVERKNESENDLNELINNAENGNVYTQVKLGKIYYCNQDFEKAIAWFKKAVEQGNDDAQFGLGLCYEFGFGLKDEEQAGEWYKKSADQKNRFAQEYLKYFGLTNCVVKWI